MREENESLTPGPVHELVRPGSFVVDFSGSGSAGRKFVLHSRFFSWLQRKNYAGALLGYKATPKVMLHFLMTKDADWREVISYLSDKEIAEIWQEA